MKIPSKAALAALLFSLGFVPAALAGTIVQFRTTLGTFGVELYDQDKPVTVGNFLRYVTNGAYADMFMHRGVTNFVIQGGGFRMAGRGTTNYYIDYLPVSYPPIVNEFSNGKFHSNAYGTIAMAKTSDPDSATSQFFINLANNAGSLDNPANSGGFTVFGHVVWGTNILDRFNPGPANAYMKLVSLGPFFGGGAFQELPVRKSATTTLTDQDLLYAGVSVAIPDGYDFGLQVSAAGDQRLISWNSIDGLTNTVDYTTVMPPEWNALTSTNGNGARCTVTDPASPAPGIRFYRVRVFY